MRKISKFFTVAVLLFVATAAFAQRVYLNGTVTEKNGDPIAGVTIQEKGSASNFAMTDSKGNFIISVPQDGAIILSCLGYVSAEVAVDGQKSMVIALETETQKLEDVIVVAYGAVRREANTGSVLSVKGAELAEAPATSVDKLLSGKMAGVSITANSGAPGSSSNIRIRGTSSINAGNEPLWVIDGIPVMTEDMRSGSYYGDGAAASTTNFLNPNDIESITVLKDAAAASVYGSRAANGVILVTTKSGKAGQAKFTARVKVGASQLANDNNIRPMTGGELIGYWRDAAVNGGYNPDDPTSAYYVPWSLLKDGTHNWYKDLTKVGLMQDYEINASGGTNRSTYYASASYHSNDGVYEGTGFQRVSVRLNADYNLTKTLKTGTRIAGVYSKTQTTSRTGASLYDNPAYSMFRFFPWTPMKNADGSYTKPAENYGVNPMAYAKLNELFDHEYRLNGSMYLEWKPIKQLTLKSNNAIEFSYVQSREYYNPLADPDGVSQLQEIRQSNIRLTTSNTITYNDTFGDHSVRVLAGQEAMKESYDGLSGDATEINPDIPYLSTATQAKDATGYSRSAYTLLSFFGIADYNYANRYFLQGSVRGDGSSLFGSNNKWGCFWSVSGSWNISNEKFMQPVTSWFNNLKLRVSYGVNGNNNIAPYLAYGVYGAGEYAGTSTMVPTRPSNEDLSWEKNKTWNVGLDLGFFDDRLTATVDVYQRLTTDMLLSVRVPATTGFGSNFRNVGSLENKGVELALNGEIIRNGDWYWSVGANIAMNRSKVLDLGGSGFLETTDYRFGQGNDTPVRIVEGRNMYSYYIREYAGVNPTTGEGLFVKEDGTLTSDRSEAPLKYMGSPEPLATGGFNTVLSWKGLSLSAYFMYSYGNKVLVDNWYITDGEDTLASNSYAKALNYWKKPGDTGCNPKPIAGGSNVWYAGYTSRFLQDGSYLRIKDITLSYDLPEKALNAMRIKGLKLYVSALNPYTFHHVDAFDPDFGELGYAYGGAYTLTKSFIGGIELTF